ncbi:MAG TPA: DUF2723 domain-containing protein, partial [Roseimicrobium sp.]|nr:DUF2723 domain-containing protein [Roseimicrobium sp.]
MDSPKNATQDFAGRKLPWLVAAGALVLYLVTLNHWVSLGSLPMVARVTGWDWWLPNLQSPAFLLVTYPIRWLPGGIQPVALNIFTATCAALTLGLLARSIALLPHDRTPEQRLRETGLHARLSIGLNWIPPLAGALALGLSLSFWEHATAASGEAFNLLMFAYVIRCLLEYRISGKQSWMDRFALVYGIAVVNDWAMIGYFPLFLPAVIWIRGWSFFSKNFLLRTTGFGLLGLLLYFYLPATGASGTHVDQSFWELFRLQWSIQKQSLLSVPRWVPLILSVATILPVVCMGIRWSNSSGDTSSIGTTLSQFLFPLVHGIFLGIGLWYMLDHIYSSRLIDPRSGFLSFYVLAALSIGYYVGYFLLVCGNSSDRNALLPAWRRGVNGLLLGIAVVAVTAIPVALIARNLPQIRWVNGGTLSRYAEAVMRELPKSGATVIADNPLYLLLAEGASRKMSPATGLATIDSRMMTSPAYHRRLKARSGAMYGSVLADRTDSQGITDLELVGYMTMLAAKSPVYYLHHSFGYYLEAMYMAPRGLINELRLYEGW